MLVGRLVGGGVLKFYDVTSASRDIKCKLLTCQHWATKTSFTATANGRLAHNNFSQNTSTYYSRTLASCQFVSHSVSQSNIAPLCSFKLNLAIWYAMSLQQIEINALLWFCDFSPSIIHQQNSKHLQCPILICGREGREGMGREGKGVWMCTYCTQKWNKKQTPLVSLQIQHFIITQLLFGNIFGIEFSNNGNNCVGF